MCPRYKMWHCLTALLRSGEKIPEASTGSQASVSNRRQEVAPRGDGACGRESTKWPQNDRSDLSPAHTRVAMGTGEVWSVGQPHSQANRVRRLRPPAQPCRGKKDPRCRCELLISKSVTFCAKPPGCDNQDNTEQVPVMQLEGWVAAHVT